MARNFVEGSTQWLQGVYSDTSAGAQDFPFSMGCWFRDTTGDQDASSADRCMLQIADMLSKSGDNIAVKHPIELYRELLDL